MKQKSIRDQRMPSLYIRYIRYYVKTIPLMPSGCLFPEPALAGGCLLIGFCLPIRPFQEVGLTYTDMSDSLETSMVQNKQTLTYTAGYLDQRIGKYDSFVVILIIGNTKTTINPRKRFYKSSKPFLHPFYRM
jgi:hypothetical protein